MRLSSLLFGVLVLGCRSTVSQVTVDDPHRVRLSVNGHEVAATPGSDTYEVPGHGPITFERQPNGSVLVSGGAQPVEVIPSDGVFPAGPEDATATYASASTATIGQDVVLSSSSSVVGNTLYVQTNYITVRATTPWANVRRVEERSTRNVASGVGYLVAGVVDVVLGVALYHADSELRWLARGLVIGGGFLGSVGVLELVSPTTKSYVEPGNRVSRDELKFVRSQGNHVHAEKGNRWGWAPALLGLAGIATSATFGWLAMDARDASAAHCSRGYCDDEGTAQAADGQRYARWSTIAGIAGAALLTGGVAALFSTSSADYKASITVAEGANRGGVQCILRF